MGRLLARLASALALSAACGIAMLGLTPAGAVETLDPRVEALNQRGIQAYDARKYHQAIDAFKQALELAPKSESVRSNLAGAYSGLGVEFLNAGEAASARKAFEESLEVGDDFYARFGLGYLHYTQNEDRDARRHLGESMRLRPDFARAPKFLALIDYRGGLEKRAIERMSLAAELDPKDREAAMIRERWRVEAEIVGKFEELVTDRFRIRHAPRLGDALARRLAAHLEEGYTEIGTALGVSMRPRRKLVVGIFDETSFHRATGTRHWIGGLFDGQIKVAVSAQQDEAAEKDASARHGPTVRALRHELAHALVNDRYPGCPNWLNEGVAQYFEFLPRAVAVEAAALPEPAASTAAGRKLELEGWNVWRREIRASLHRQKAQRLAFSTVPARLWELSDEAEARWTYLQGLGFVDHLAERHGLFRVRILLELAHELGSLRGAFEKTYGKKLEALEDEWWETLASNAAG